jgi:hypothetical protein
MVEFEIVSELMFELPSSGLALPIAEPEDEHRASIWEFTTETIPTDEFPLYVARPLPIADPSDELDALMVELAIISAVISCLVEFAVPGPMAGMPVAETDEFTNDKDARRPSMLTPKPGPRLPPSTAMAPDWSRTFARRFRFQPRMAVSGSVRQ